VQNVVTVGAHRPQILNWIDNILIAEFRERPDVMDMDIAIRLRSVCLTEAEVADDALGSVGLDASTPRFPVTLVRIHRNA
jgi:hypothetical protein